MTANVDAMVKEGIRAFKGNKKDEARALFEKATELDQYNEQAWLWLSAVVDTEEDQRVCLENVLFINPDNAAAKKGLSKLVDSEEEDVIATSSASSNFTPEETAPEVYDEWVDNLNIGSSDDSSSVNPFSSDIDEDLFEDAFSGEFDPFEEQPSYEDAFGNDPFATNTEDDMEAVEVDSDYDEEDDDVFADDSSDAAFAIEDDPFVDIDDMSGGPFGSETYDDEPMYASETSSPARSPVSSPVPESPVSSGDTGTLNQSADDDPSVYFAKIPNSIRATRVPGNNERYPAIVVLSLFILIIANVGAIGFFVIQLMG